jgi:hypothetical protein
MRGFDGTLVDTTVRIPLLSSQLAFIHLHRSSHSYICVRASVRAWTVSWLHAFARARETAFVAVVSVRAPCCGVMHYRAARSDRRCRPAPPGAARTVTSAPATPPRSAAPRASSHPRTCAMLGLVQRRRTASVRATVYARNARRRDVAPRGASRDRPLLRVAVLVLLPRVPRVLPSTRSSDSSRSAASDRGAQLLQVGALAERGRQRRDLRRPDIPAQRTSRVRCGERTRSHRQHCTGCSAARQTMR